MMLWPSIAKPCIVHFLVECCGSTAEFDLSFPLWCLLLLFCPKSFPYIFTAWDAKAWQSQLAVDVCDCASFNAYSLPPETASA